MDRTPDEKLKLENQLCFHLYACSRRIVSDYTPYLKPLGITYTQYIVLMVLWEQDGITVGELCRKLYLDSGTVTPLLKKLEERGILTRRRCQEDERCVSVWLTEKGHKLKEKAYPIPDQVCGCMPLDEEEAGTLYKLLYKILDQM